MWIHIHKYHKILNTAVNPSADKAAEINARLQKVTSEEVKNIKPATDFGTDYNGDRTELQVG